MTLATHQARTLLEEMEQVSADALRLAQIVSLAVRVEPELLRQSRLKFLPDVDAGAEAELWFSPLVESYTPLALVLMPEIADLLRQDLASNQTLLDQVWSLLAEVHVDAPPAIRLEEEVIYLALSSQADAPERLEQRLLSAVQSLVVEDRRGLARWAAQALPRLPKAVQQSQAAWMLALAAGARLGGRQLLGSEVPANAVRDWLPSILPPDMPRVPIFVQLVVDGVELSTTPMSGSHTINVPKTAPLLVEVTWKVDGHDRSEQVVLTASQPRRIKSDRGPIIIQTALGERYQIEPLEVPIAQTDQEPLRVFLSYAAPDASFAAQLQADLRHQGFQVLGSDDHPGTPFLPAIRESLMIADRYVPIVSENSPMSAWLANELRLARDLCQPIIPLLRTGNLDLLPDSLRELVAVRFDAERAYSEALRELVQALRQPVDEPGALWEVPELPRSYIPQTAALQLQNSILTSSEAVLSLVEKNVFSIQGLGGIGKSVTAAAIARDCDIRRAFPDGIFWIHVGQDPSLPFLQSQLATAIAGSPQVFTDVDQGAAGLAQLLNNKACLIVLNDVWSVRQVETFRRRAPRSAFVITTRDSQISSSIGAFAVQLAAWDDEAIAQLLLRESQESTASEDVSGLAYDCRGLPFATALVGALKNTLDLSWRDIWTRFRSAYEEHQVAQADDGLYPQAIATSLDALDRTIRERFLMLAIFPADYPLPTAVFSVLWGSSATDARSTLDLLVRRMLLRNESEGVFSLHAIVAAYLRASVDNLSQLDNRLLDAYAERCSDGWASGPDDGYFFEQLAFHLEAADRMPELQELLCSFAWLQAKINAAGIAALLADYELVLAGFTGSATIDPEVTEAGSDANAIASGSGILDALRVIQRTLQRSASILAHGSTQLAGQLLARLPAHPSVWVTELQQQARLQTNHLRLRPLLPSLADTQTNIAEVPRHTTPVKGVAVTPDGKYIASIAADESLVKIWDGQTGLVTQTLSLNQLSATALLFILEGKQLLVALDDGSLVVWDTTTWTLLQTIGASGLMLA